MKEFLLDVLRVPSVSNNLDEIKRSMQLFVKRAEQHNLEVIWNEDPLYCIIGRGNLLHPDVGFICHIDVVPPYIPPKIEGDKIYGRGTMDMLGPTVACFEAIIQSEKNNISIALTSDEEIGGDCAAYVAKQFIPKRVLFCPDQNRDFNITKKAKGGIAFSLIATGRTAHGSIPWTGENAVEKLIAALPELQGMLKNDNEWKNSFNLSFIKTDNVAYNVVPEKAVMGCDVRFTEHDASYWHEKIKKFAKEHNLDLEVESLIERINIDMTDDIIRYCQDVETITGTKPNLLRATSSCDARFYQGRVPTIIITKTPGGHSHAPDEYVSYKGLEDFTTILKRFLDHTSPQTQQ